MMQQVGVRKLARMRGASLTSVLFWGVIAGAAVILAMRVVPFYTEYSAIQRALQAAVTEGEPQAIRSAFERRISADYITSVSSKDLEIRKNGAGAWEARVAYEKVVPLVANISLLFSFEAKAPR